MQSHIHQDGDQITLQLQGRLDDAGASRLSSLFAILVEGGWPEVFLDLGLVDFIGSTAIGRLLRLQAGLAKRGANLRLIKVPPAILALLSTMNLDKVLSLSRT